MSYNIEPTADYVQKFGERKIREWSNNGQKAMDDAAAAIYLKTKTIAVSEPEGQKGETPIKKRQMGFAGIVVDRDAAMLAAQEFMKVHPRDEKLKTKEHANGLLEPWLNGSRDRSARRDVLFVKNRDFRLFGRGVEQMTALPQIYADDEFRELTEKHDAALDARGDAKSDKEKKEAQERIDGTMEDMEDWKASNFPLRWRHVPSRTWYPDLSDERELPEAVEVREMTAGEIKANWGDKALPGSLEDVQDSRRVKVYEYGNWFWSALVIPDKEGKSPTMPLKWEHGLRMNPYILTEVNRQPTASTDKNKVGVWKSAMFDFMDMLDLQDQILSDASHAHQREALKPMVLKLDSEARAVLEGDASITGLDEVKPDENNIIRLLTTESAEAGPTSTVDEQSMALLAFANDYNTQLTLNPALHAALLKSGTSAIAFEGQKQAAREWTGPWRRANARSAQKWAALAFRSVIRLAEEFPNAPDEIVVVDEKFGKIAVTPKDVKGWEAYVTLRQAEVNPLSQNAQMSLAVAALNLPIDPARILEVYLQYENGDEEIDRWAEWMIFKALVEAQVASAAQQAEVIAAAKGAKTPQELAELLATIPANAQAAIALSREGALEGQSASNTRRAGVPQQMSQTAAQEVGTVAATP